MSNESERAKFAIDAAVRVVRRIYNDGSFAGATRGDLLVAKGSIGQVLEVGLFLQTQLIYSVFFADYGYAVGVRESELIAADDPWQPSLFEFRQKVRVKCALSVQGELRVGQGTHGQILKVDRSSTPVHYHVNFGNDKLYSIAETLLETVDELPN
ncbi:nitrogen fixation protein NifZ [Celerinatantimonas yamalensis]|uniref:Nitrogen fixation protein NifZ n=1 Tax=Celerinatantimonas yamalensis TaxID=559956 RepID=A0ABW9G4F6_9GAMM